MAKRRGANLSKDRPCVKCLADVYIAIDIDIDEHQIHRTRGVSTICKTCTASSARGFVDEM